MEQYFQRTLFGFRDKRLERKKMNRNKKILITGLIFGILAVSAGSYFAINYYQNQQRNQQLNQQFNQEINSLTGKYPLYNSKGNVVGISSVQDAINYATTCEQQDPTYHCTIIQVHNFSAFKSTLVKYDSPPNATFSDSTGMPGIMYNPNERSMFFFSHIIYSYDNYLVYFYGP
jgi:hypothetical protein